MKPRFLDRRQVDSWSCGAITGAVCLEIAGVDTLMASELVRASLSITPLDGTDPRSLESFFRRVGCRVQSGEMCPRDLAHHTALGRPVACLITFDSVGHWVTVYGANSRFISYHCPVRGLVRDPIGRFRKHWRDYDRGGATYDGFGVCVVANKDGERARK